MLNRRLLFETLPLWQYMDLVVEEWELARGRSADTATALLLYDGCVGGDTLACVHS